MKKTILNPAATRALVPHLAKTRNPNVWIYRYDHPNSWRLSIATHAEPGSNKLSLGGFRIAPEERTSMPGFDSDIEAIELAMGMEDKVCWSRILGVGGPLARRDISRIVGGKCVLHPTADGRVGQPRDRELLDFATACLIDCDLTAGIRITTGQDLGHGIMSDGRTESLDYLHRGFRGSVVADTSKPTAQGNYHVLCGMLEAFDVSPADATVGLIGCGKVGMHVIERLREHGTRMVAVEATPERRDALARLGVTVRAPHEKGMFLSEPMDALVLNASGNSLDRESVRLSAANSRLKVVCGSENLVMQDPLDADIYRAAHKAYCPTELGGMMGYLTAVEQYLAELESLPFDVASLMEAAASLGRSAREAVKYMVHHDFAIGFEAAIEANRSQLSGP